MPFFTLLDPRAKIKGSRDPLGFQSVWTRLGRQVIQNLTTVTTSVRGFTTLLLGLYFAEQMVTQAGADEGNISNIFLKFEQLAAYSRVAYNGNLNDELDILGIRRVKRNLQDKRGAVHISAHQDDQILANQKTYGLWGLYTVAGRNSGLVESDHARLTPIARNFVENEYLPRLNHVTHSLYAFLTKAQIFEPTKKQASLGATLANLLGPQLTPAEISFYTHHLLYGGEEDTLQQRLWEQIKAISIPDPFSMIELKEVIHHCHKLNDDSLALRLKHIQRVEQVIAPAGYLLGFLLSRDGQTRAHVADEVKQTWGDRLSHLDPAAFGRVVDSIEDVELEVRTRLVQLAETLQMGQYELAIDLCLAQNKEVMKARGSQPWLTLKNRQLDVRLREEADWLPKEALRQINHLAVYYDRAGLTAEAQPAQLDYRRIPLQRLGGYFHPKNILLLLENSNNGKSWDSLLIGTMSANLTRSGWWENVEIAHFEEVHQGEKRSLRDDLRALVGRLKREDKTGNPHSALNEIYTFLTRQIRPIKQQTKNGRWRPRLYIGQQPVPEFLQTFIPQGFNLEIISPYFDDTDSATTLRALVDTLKPKATRLCLPEGKDGAALCRPGFFAAVEQLPSVRWGRLPTGPLRLATDEQHKQAPRFVHAKVYRFWNKAREIFFVGSVNLTRAAHQAGRGGNLETAILVESPNPARLGWWLELLDEDRPGEFRPEIGQDIGLDEQIENISLRFDWASNSLAYFWEKPRGSEPQQATITAQGTPLFPITPIQFNEWLVLPETATQAVRQLLKSTSLVEVSVDGAPPFRILIQEEGMAHKPSILLSLTAEEILQYWSLLSPEQREAFINIRATDLAKDTQIRLSSIKLPVGTSMFDRFAGIFHAFSRLEHHITTALEAQRDNEAVYRLFGQKYDSLPALIEKVANDEQADPVNRYVTLLCAQQLLQKLTQEHPEFMQQHQPALSDLQQQLQIIDQVRASFTFDTPTEREQFFNWFERMFFLEIPVQEATQ